MIACLVGYAPGGDDPWLVFIDLSKVRAAGIAEALKTGHLVVSEDSWEEITDEAEIETFPLSVVGKASVWLE